MSMQTTMRNLKGYSLAPSAQGGAIAFWHGIAGFADLASAGADAVNTK